MAKNKKQSAVTTSKDDLPKVSIEPLSAFSQDSENANKGTEKGTDLLKKSLSARKFARPTFAAKDKTILGGNKTLSAAAEVGMQEAIVIETDGSRPIIHVRTDLANSKSPEARRLAIEDNRIAQVSLDWDEKILGAFAEFDEKLLEGLWDESFLKQLLNDDFNSVENEPMNIKEQFQVLIEDLTEDEQRILLEKLNGDGYKCRALIS